RLPGFEQQLRINVTGCPNSCGQHWIADLGIEGKKIKVDGAIVDAYYFCVGGAVGRHQAVARPIGLRLPATAVAPAIERLLKSFLAERRSTENFRQFAARHTDEELRGLLAGELVEAVARDVAPDGPPRAGDVNAAVARGARERGLWINAADDPARCTFILPALVRRGDLTVAVATGGSSPALARAIREELETYLTDDYTTLASIAAEARRELRAAGRPVTADAWRRALGPEVRRLIVERGRDDAKHRLLELLRAES